MGKRHIVGGLVAESLAGEQRHAGERNSSSCRMTRYRHGTFHSPSLVLHSYKRMNTCEAAKSLKGSHIPVKNKLS